MHEAGLWLAGRHVVHGEEGAARGQGYHHGGGSRFIRVLF
jgi:hypothetical protein